MLKKQVMKKITDEIKYCKKCELCKSRNNPVIGEGNLNTEIMFIGEAPGYNEDKQGIPFVGKAGKILDELLHSIGLQREDVYIANILKCRPPENRNPLKTEIDACTEYLNRQIELIQPKIIIPMGNFACSFIFEKYCLDFKKISNVHGKIFNVNTFFGELKIIPMYHPAVATYNPNKKTILLQDFSLLKLLLS